jgi:hypothetical protein
MKNTVLHVVRNPRGGWRVKWEGSNAALAHAYTQKEAIEIGKRLARKYAVALIIHKMSGEVLLQKDFSMPENVETPLLFN